MNNKRFINLYEKEIKDKRDEYYKNIILNSQKPTNNHKFLTYLIPAIIAILILVALDYSIVSYLISLISLVLINSGIYMSYISKIENNEYLDVIRKYGFSSIEDYESKLKQYVTGPNGYYNNLLLDLVERYNINKSTKKIETITGEVFYIWSSKNKDRVYLLSTKYNKKPSPIILPISNIRYFRVDNNTHSVILKTDNDMFNFKEEYVTLFNELIKEKRLENIKKHDPATHINDYEIYMYKIKKAKEKDYSKKHEIYDNSIKSSIYSIVAIVLLIILSITVPKISTIIKIVNTIIVLFFNYLVIKSLNNKVKKSIKKDHEVIKELNNDPDNIRIFNELKYVLGIKDTYDKVYTNEHAEYLTWIANGYFHVFLNIIYFNSVYMAVKTSDVKYYKVENDECIIKLKDKTLTFDASAGPIFNKILPNKDYYWIKSYQKK